MKHLFIVIITSCILASCGVKSDPSYPEGNHYPRTYPLEESKQS